MSVLINKVLLENIINCKVKFEEIEDFSIGISSTELDLDNSFSKYYSLQKIENAINKYRNADINGEYLAHWANAYNWIIMATLHEKCVESGETPNFKEYIEYEISDSLDGLSFFDESDIDDDINSYFNDVLKEFKYYDNIYKEYENLEIYCKEQKIIDYHYENLVFLCVNRVKKVYFIFNDINISAPSDKVNEKQISEDEFVTTVSELNKIGYNEIFVKNTRWE